MTDIFTPERAAQEAEEVLASSPHIRRD